MRDHKKRHIRLNKRAVGVALILILIANVGARLLLARSRAKMGGGA